MTGMWWGWRAAEVMLKIEWSFLFYSCELVFLAQTCRSVDVYKRLTDACVLRVVDKGGECVFVSLLGEITAHVLW